MEYSNIKIIGDGTVPMALIDRRDIGKYVAKIIVDPNTLNKQVFAYGEVWTQTDGFKLLETASGESVNREVVSALREPVALASTIHVHPKRANTRNNRLPRLSC
jgi:hypothetical protein